MLALKNLLMAGGIGMMIAAVCILAYDLYRGVLYRRASATAGSNCGSCGAAVAHIVGAGDAGVGTNIDGAPALWWCPAAWPAFG